MWSQKECRLSCLVVFRSARHLHQRRLDLKDSFERLLEFCQDFFRSLVGMQWECTSVDRAAKEHLGDALGGIGCGRTGSHRLRQMLCRIPKVDELQSNIPSAVSSRRQAPSRMSFESATALRRRERMARGLRTATSITGCAGHTGGLLVLCAGRLSAVRSRVRFMLSQDVTSWEWGRGDETRNCVRVVESHRLPLEWTAPIPSCKR